MGDVSQLLFDLIDTIGQQEMRSLVSSRRQPSVVSAFTSFYACEFEVVSETSKNSLSKLDVSYQSKNTALFVAISNLAAQLLPRLSCLSPTVSSLLWNVFHRSMLHFSQYMVDSEPSPPKIFAFEASIKAIKALICQSILPLTDQTSHFVSDLIQSALIALFGIPTSSNTDSAWSNARSSLTELLYSVSSLSSFSLTCFPSGFIATLSSKLSSANKSEIGFEIANGLFALYHSRLQIAFVPSLTWYSIQESLPHLLRVPEMRYTVRMFSKSLKEFCKNSSTKTPLSQGALTYYSPSKTISLPSNNSFEPPSSKRAKLAELAAGGNSISTLPDSKRVSSEPSFAKGLQTFINTTNQLISDANHIVKSTDPQKTQILLDSEIKAINAALTLLRVQMDNLEVKYTNTSGSSSANRRSKRAAANPNFSNSTSKSSSTNAVVAALLNQKMLQRCDIDQLSNGILVTARMIADFLIERISPPKLAALPLFSLASDFVDCMIDLMTQLPPHDSQFPGATVGVLIQLCELPFSSAQNQPSSSASTSIHRPPSLFASSNNVGTVSTPNVNAQTDKSEEVFKFAEKALLLSTLLNSSSSRSSEPHLLFQSALNDARPKIVQAAIRHFPLALARFSENSLLNSEILHVASQAASNLCKSILPLPKENGGNETKDTTTKPSSDLLASVDAICRFSKGVACLSCVERFGFEDGSFASTSPSSSSLCISSASHSSSLAGATSDEFRLSLVRSSGVTGPVFDFVCRNSCINGGLNNFTHPKTSSSSYCFWKMTTPRANHLTALKIDWTWILKLLSEYKTSNIDYQLRLMLLDANKSVFCHHTLPSKLEVSNTRSSAKSLSPSASKSASSRMDVDKTTKSGINSSTSSHLPAEVTNEISSLFHIAVHAPNAHLSHAATEALVSLIDCEPEKGKSSLNDAILNEMSNVTSSLNRSTSSQNNDGNITSHMDVDGVSSEEALLRVVGRIGGKARGWYVLHPLFLLLNYLTNVRVTVKACAYENICRLSADHGMSQPRDLLKKYEPKVGLHLAQSLKRTGALLEEVCLTILDIDPIEYLVSCFGALLPKIALKKDGELLELIAAKTNRKPASILLDNMTPILVAAVCTPHTPFETVQFVVKIAKIHAGELFKRHWQGILIGIVLQLGDKSKKQVVLNSMDLLIGTLGKATNQNESGASQQQSSANASSAQTRSNNQGASSSSASNVTSPSRAKKGSSKTNTTNSSANASASNANNANTSDISTPSVSQQFKSREDLVAANFLRISNQLVYEHILKSSAPMSSRLNALNAYKRLIKLLGSHIDKFYVIIGSILRLAMSEVPELRGATCKAWKSFLKSVPDKCLGPILGATTVYLLSSDTSELDIAPILEYLFIEKENVLKNFFSDVPLLPSSAALSKVQEKWIMSQKDRLSTQDVFSQLSQLIVLARNDDISIREMALKQLINFLHLHRNKIARFVSAGENRVDPGIVDLVVLLVNGGRDPIHIVRAKFAQALGELGAIDPSRLANHLPPSISVPVLDLTEEQFAAALIEKYLVKTYRTVRLLPHQDRVCFTIQEVLAYFDCEPATATRSYSEQRRDTVLWSMLNPETQSLVHPFLASQYILHKPERWNFSSSSQLPPTTCPISSFQHGMSYATWLELWLERLIIDSKSGLFQACLGILSTYDYDTAHYILPHIVLSILHNGSQAAHDAILNEMLVVLGARSPSSASHFGNITHALTISSSSGTVPHPSSTMGQNANTNPSNRLGTDYVNPMAAQRIFALIDALSQWVESKYAQFREKHDKWSSESKENAAGNENIASLSSRLTSSSRNSSSNNDGQPKVDPRVHPVELLLSKIPQLSVSKTALSINAYSRSLMHFEKAARERSLSSKSNPSNLSTTAWNQNNFGENSDAPPTTSAGLPPIKTITEPSELALLQQICSNLDDPDVLEGISHLNPTGRGVSELLDSYRAGGRWNETLIALDQLMRQKTSDSESLCTLQEGRLECLAELGLLDQLSNLATSCLNDPVQTAQPKHMQRVRSFGAHAAWKLGDWKAVENLICEHDRQTGATNYLELFAGHFDLAIGKIFLSLKNKKKAQFDNVLQVMRNDVIQPLGAASLESYDRAYPMIVKLHMLNELEDSWKLLHGVDGGGNNEDKMQASPAGLGSKLPYGKDANNPANVSITHPDLLDKSIGGLIQLNNSFIQNTSTVLPPNLNGIQALQSSSSGPTISPTHSSNNLSESSIRQRTKILSEWKSRLEITQYSYKVRESILSLRLAVFGMADMHKEATETWLELAKMARKTSRFTQAQGAIMRLRNGSELASALESAKLLWASGEKAMALVEIEKIVEQARTSPVLNLADSSSTTSNVGAPSMGANHGVTGTSGAIDAALAQMKAPASIMRQKLVESRQSSSGAIPSPQTVHAAPESTRSRSNLSRSNSVHGGNINDASSTAPGNDSLIERDLFATARLLKARWMLESQYSVQSVTTAFREAGDSDQSQSKRVKANFYQGLFHDHLCTEYKRKLYSLPPKPPKSSSSSSSSSRRATATSSRASTGSQSSNSLLLPPMLTPQALQYWSSMRHAFSSLTLSLLSSTNYCYQILPRLVTMWFEIAEALQDLFVQYPESVLQNINRANVEPWNVKIPNKKHLEHDKTAKMIIEYYFSAMTLISMLLKRIPSYVWLISYSLLISGCVHRNKDVEELIGRIILKVLHEHPQQAIWHIFPLNYSNSEDRKAKYSWIRKQTANYTYKDASISNTSSAEGRQQEKEGSKISSNSSKNSENSLYQFFDEAASLAHQFTVLCGHKVPREKGSSSTTLELNLSDTCLIEQRIPKALIMPSEQQLSCIQFLDSSSSSSSSLSSQHDAKNPFSYQPVYIRKAHPKVTILRSLARPRKLILYGSDNLEYWFLCKPVDDLRKDARMMEFNAMVNRLLKKDLETRRRDLRIRTYSVLPLSDNSGILNWVPNTNGIRGVISDIYAMDGLDLSEKIREIRKQYEGSQGKKDWEATFTNELLPKFPLALSKWFLQQFTEPSQWFRARTNFARTCGVMSVVGTILGLGDRHCENILLDSKTGDCLHVDLNCIFHKGRSFAIPEVVPFRLTRNMVDAFGVTGVEGVFRRACELTMQLMTDNKDALLSVLGTFVHDPLFEWSADSNSSSTSSAASMTRHAQQQQQQQQQQNQTKNNESVVPLAYSHERHNKLAVEILNGISDRLDGLMRTPDNLDQLIVPLSTAGFVDAIITEATSNANLSKMYVGWSSFL